MDFFISHSSADREWVELVCKRIGEQGFTAYLAEHDLQPGNVLNDKIEGRIRSCDAFVVILTDNASTSTIVGNEVGFAKAERKPILPLVAPSVAQSPAALGMLNGVEYVPFDIESPETGLLALTDWVQRFAREQQTADYQAALATIERLVNAQEHTIGEQAQRIDQLQLQRERDLVLGLIVFVGVLAAVALLTSEG